MTSRPHVVVLHRWRDSYADYARYLDHATHAVTYISTEVGAVAVPADACEIVIVPATDDHAVVAGVVRALAARFGPPAAVVALKEDDLLVAARLRAEWDCPGPTLAQTTPFRDKLRMGAAVAARGVDVPAFAAAETAADVHTFAATHGWPVVLKPRDGSSSAGVAVLHGAEEVPAVVPGSMVQVFATGAIHHIDGVFDGSTVTTSTVSRYLRTCLDFRGGVPVGSVELDDPETRGRARDFATEVLRALTTRPTVFHLEAFAGPTGFRFLEVGARAGGAEIPFLWRELHGYDLNEAAFRIAMGERPPAATEMDEVVGGLLIVPAPARRPCRIESATSMLGVVPELYAEVVLAPGQILPAADAYYEHVGGRFRFRGASTDAVATAVNRVAAQFRISGAPLPSAARDHAGSAW